MTPSKLSNSCWTLFLTQTFKMVAHTAAVLASQFIPSWKLSLTFSTVLICSVPRHGSTHSNSSGHICGTSPDCSWSICDIFSGPLLVSIHKITAHTHWHSCYKYCMLYITKFCQGEKEIQIPSWVRHIFGLQCCAISGNSVKRQQNRPEF